MLGQKYITRREQVKITMASVEVATGCADEPCKLPKSTKEKTAYIKSGTFNLDNREQVKLEGNYYIKTIENKLKPVPYEDENIRNQAVYALGNVLIRKDTEDILELIDLFIRYTHDPCKDVKVSIIGEEKQMCWGTICPTKKKLFTYRSKVFVAYGRYIYGYDRSYVTFERGVDIKDKGVEYVDEFEELEDEITADKIILSAPKYDENVCEYVYSFCIYDSDTEVIDAFGLYR